MSRQAKINNEHVKSIDGNNDANSNKGWNVKRNGVLRKKEERKIKRIGSRFTYQTFYLINRINETAYNLVVCVHWRHWDVHVLCAAVAAAAATDVIVMVFFSFITIYDSVLNFYWYYLFHFTSIWFCFCRLSMEPIL